MHTPTTQLERILAAYRLTLGAWSHADTAEGREDSDNAAWCASEAVQLVRRGELFSALEYARVARVAESAAEAARQEAAKQDAQEATP